MKNEIKYLKHTFTQDEKVDFSSKLARAIAEKRGKESEFDGVKAQFKSELAKLDANMDALATAVMNGFEMRNEQCVVFLNPREKKKFYVLAATHNPEIWDPPKVVLEEDMTAEDFQQELIEAESKFEKKVEIPIFKATERDSGLLIVGMFQNKWYAALRIVVGKKELKERLDTEQKCFKHRKDAISKKGKAALEWFKENFPQDYKGFEQPCLDAVAAQMEREE